MRLIRVFGCSWYQFTHTDTCKSIPTWAEWQKLMPQRIHLHSRTQTTYFICWNLIHPKASRMQNPNTQTNEQRQLIANTKNDDLLSVSFYSRCVTSFESVAETFNKYNLFVLFQFLVSEERKKSWHETLFVAFVRKNIRQILPIYLIHKLKYMDVKIILFRTSKQYSNWQAWRFVAYHLYFTVIQSVLYCIVYSCAVLRHFCPLVRFCV